MKPLLTGVAVCAALAIFAGHADAHKAPVHKSRHARIHASFTALTAKGGPLHDCVHVTFPQCDSHGPDQPND